jgi:hypothetical protein
MKKFLFLGVGFMSLGAVLVFQAEAHDTCYSNASSSRLSCANRTRICSACTTRQYGCSTRCLGAARSNLVYRRVRQVPAKCSYSYCNNYSYGTRSYVNYQVTRPVVTYRSRVNTSYSRNVYNYRYVTPTTACTSHATCSTKVPVIRLVRPVTYSSYYPYNNSAVNNTVIVNVN